MTASTEPSAGEARLLPAVGRSRLAHRPQRHGEPGRQRHAPGAGQHAPAGIQQVQLAVRLDQPQAAQEGDEFVRLALLPGQQVVVLQGLVFGDKDAGRHAGGSACEPRSLHRCDRVVIFGEVGQRWRRTRIQALPDMLRRVAEMSLLHERSSGDICQALQISEQNLSVRLHQGGRVLAS